MKATLEKVLNWVLLSSANPEQVSLTVKGALLGIVPAIMAVAGVAHLGLGQDQVTTLFDGIAQLVQDALTVVATAAMVYGAARKVWLSLRAPSQA